MQPLVDLHLHLDGSIRIKTMLDIAKREGVSLPAKDAAGLRKALRCGEIRDSLADYLSAFPITVSVMQSPKALARVSAELLEDFAAEGGRYAEVRFCPLLHARNGLRSGPRSGHNLTPAEVVEAVLEGMKESGEAHGVGWGLILCTMRHFAPRQTEEIALLAKAYRREGVVAIDMAGNDCLPVLGKHARHFRWARSHDVNVTMHVAESGPPEEIYEAIHSCGAQRIGHGTKAVERPRVLDAMENNGVAVEVCETSNVQTRVVDSYEAHPMPVYLRERAGILTTLNTDNRMLADTTVAKEFALARRHHKLTEEEEIRLHLNAINASFASDAVKDRLRAELAARAGR